MLRCLQRTETDPYFNLAAEEYLLMNAFCDTFMLWRNEEAIVIGKHQNMAREVNHAFVSGSSIPVIRRITGGGTVYHDPGNINFSFIRLSRKENPVDFRLFTRPIILFLKSMGIAAEFEGKSNIVIRGKKVSGNSAHVFKGRVLHHGTLLFNTNLDILQKTLNISEKRYQDKSVRSVRKDVANISTHLSAVMTAEDFMESLFSFIINLYEDAYLDRLSLEEIEGIAALALNKYSSKEWNAGYSPDYQFNDSWDNEEGRFTVTFSAREAVIESLSLEGPEKYAPLFKVLEKSLPGTFHEKNSISERLKSLTFANEIEVRLLNQLIDHLF